MQSGDAAGSFPITDREYKTNRRTEPRPRLGGTPEARRYRDLMRVGKSIRSFYPEGDPRAIARSVVERAAAARRAGLDSLIMGDHHATTEPYMQNVGR